ncbi:hypothetical protein A1O3_03927 [Capronia epimyces CBS 606.96]|uniref:Uncharacterized protein n=1 Tax=Capronia epimyces CBS 606.96 TaxID=1182542 RepID=W9Y3B0_9EURO|nr:uncharacterized protein A1O3_03927 [Capronia epimyces CBS 606.96]EXJ86973.1 hypothetical protein A1O3_03927 [Capronia epimyces CBS 606.96]
MSFFTSDRAVVVFLLLGLGTAYYTIPSLLDRVKNEARAPEPEPPAATKRLQKDSENSLKIETLRTLADGYSHELRTSAIKIVANRTARSRSKRLLLRDLASKDYGRRDNAINGLWMLLYHPALTETKMSNELHDGTAAAATVRALINILPLHHMEQHDHDHDHDQTPEEKSLPASPVRPAHRPAHEVSLLIILNNTLSYAGRRIASQLAGNEIMDAALDAGLVTRWLAKYPFPCALPENAGFNYKKADVARLFDRMAWLTDDPLMADIVLEVMQYPRGRKEMRDVGLQGSRYRENMTRGGGGSYNSGWDLPAWVTAADSDRDVRMIGGEDTAGMGEYDIVDYGGRAGPAHPPPRSTERSQEEEHLRRRHREAIVVAERGAPLRRENILQRENSQPLQPMNGTSEVEGVLNGLLGLSDHAQPQSSPVSPSIRHVPSLILEQEDRDRRPATELDRILDVHEIEHMIEESLSHTRLGRDLGTLESNEHLTLQAVETTASTQDSGNGTDSDSDTPSDQDQGT